VRERVFGPGVKKEVTENDLMSHSAPGGLTGPPALGTVVPLKTFPGEKSVVPFSRTPGSSVGKNVSVKFCPSETPN
jgi:hypothetical protein